MKKKIKNDRQTATGTNMSQDQTVGGPKGVVYTTQEGRKGQRKFLFVNRGLSKGLMQNTT